MTTTTLPATDAQGSLEGGPLFNPRPYPVHPASPVLDVVVPA